MPVVQKFIAGAMGLGALYLVITNPNGAYKLAQSIQKVVGGTTTEIVTGGRHG